MERSAMSDNKTCQHCGKPVPQESRMCLFCGGEAPRPAIHRIPYCPRCKVELDPHAFRDTDLDMCPTCHGIWCDVDEFKRLTTEADVIRDPNVPAEYRRPPLPDEVGYLPCPRCHEIMARQNFKSLSNVVIDWCRDHGVWLDPGEMEKIRAFIASGGLEAAQDMELRRNRGDLESLATEFRDAEFSRRILQQKSLKSWIFG